MLSKIRTILLILSLISIISASHYEVENLFPGLYDDHKIYAGYLDTNVEGNILFYTFTPSQSDPDNDPLLLWLNGGPGCSSLFGWLGEVGPVVSDLYSGVWKRNEYSWNKNVSIVYIESPAGVGFSKTNDPEHEWKESETAQGLLYAMKNFFKEFEGFDQRDFYISGESYAGIYIPNLVEAIVRDPDTKKINLKGVLIGNGLTDFESDNERSGVEFAYWHGMISSDSFKAFESNCPHLSPEIPNDIQPRNVTHKCNEIRREISKSFIGLDIYGIYRPCKQYGEYDERDQTSYRTYIKKMFSNINKKLYANADDDQEIETDIFVGGCSDDFIVDDLLNDPATKEKLRVDQNITWRQCVGVNYPLSESLNFYKEIVPTLEGIKVWFFSGDTDGILNTLGTMRWIDKLKFDVKEPFKQWKVDDQVGGFIQRYDHNFTLVTVIGAGHMVPQDRRKEAYTMLMGFIHDDL